MKRFAAVIVLSTSLAAVPAMADHNGALDVGGVIGAAVGGYLGSKVGHGTGRAAATAAGAVGGYLVGEKISHDQRGRAASHGKYYGHQQATYQHRGYHETRVHPIRETYVARSDSNVRAGPGTRYPVVGGLHRHERVRVIGQVEGSNWYMVDNGGHRAFVYAPLLEPRGHYRRGNNDSHSGYSGYYDGHTRYNTASDR
jgi:outer membrane lipoprotein SlyB